MYSDDFIIENYLSTRLQTLVFPKSDGRVEVPQQIVNQAGFKNKKYVYAGYISGELYLSETPTFNKSNITSLGKMIISKGRIRICAGFLKKCSFINKPLSMIATNGIVVIKLDNDNTQSKIKIKEFVDGLNDEQKKSVVEIILQTFPNVSLVSGDKTKLDRVENQKVIDISGILDPELIMLDISHPIVFRPFGMPIRFPGYWSPEHHEIVISKEKNPTKSPMPIYLIPGIEKLLKGEVRIGYLLLDSDVYSDLVYYMKNYLIYVDRDIIFWYDSCAKSKFKFFNNPIIDISEDVIKKTEKVLVDKKDFISNTFRVFDSCDDLQNLIPLLTRQSVNIYNKI